MDLLTLRTFVEVMQRGSFAAVARERSVAPSSISRAVAGLEDELGLRLFQRTTRRLTPTEAGSMYFERIAPLVEELEHAQVVATDINNRPVGCLRISAPVAFAELYVVPLLPTLAARHPELSVDLRLCDAMTDLVAERIDVAIRLGRLSDSSTVARRLGPMERVICASPGYLERHGRPQHPSQVVDHDSLMFPFTGHGPLWRFRDRASGTITEVSARCRFLISSGLALRECVRAGVGLCMLPRWLVAEDFACGRLIDVFPDYDVTATEFDASIWLLFPSRDYVPLKVRAFTNLFEQQFAAGAPWERPHCPRAATGSGS